MMHVMQERLFNHDSNKNLHFVLISILLCFHSVLINTSNSQNKCENLKVSCFAVNLCQDYTKSFLDVHLQHNIIEHT